MNQSLSQATNAILAHLLMDLKSGNIRRCESLGMTIEEVRQLSQLTIDDLHYLMQSSVSVLNLSINHTNFWIIVQQARIEQQRMQRIDRALELGGSIELMQTYFGLTTAEVSARRRLNDIDTRQGRTQALNEQEDADIWTQWRDSGLSAADSHEALDVMMLAAEQHDVSLTAVWSRVSNWCREASRKTNKREDG
ncbi:MULTISPECIES: DUF2857 domain-containing protein [Yersinia pseudotuberculosis complex]|uniref:DUF2857 domain-containing protein n=2 Tax=Yersinia pseudotuberculosis complex TaxID=1649845 RepID=Q6EVX5_YERPU|nr:MULTISPECIES: DUF2857 domain-containing protein [Yersinia pseudotuberculosis complex]AHK18411.1 hypothetical protein BF17_02810 [Yersinia similis]AYW90872.1 DUF2857 domain-containing protein [Yersinia pseudotuberculosis]KGA63359.1 hypothetical protein DJ55_1650 [Yersinia pseudotuberculosis]CAF28478.1 hypothetical protein [Yersinia pseudotuberculosis]CFQ63314.1 Protein of uncharacterised function (DUF2857) [Yersinia similis]